MATMAKIFWNGNSQAVRLPKAFRFPHGTEEVEIRRQGERLVLEPVRPQEWPESFWQAFGGHAGRLRAPSPAFEGARIRAHLERQGNRIGDLDSLIAAHAFSLNLIMVTNNLREFSRVPELRTENWVLPG